MSAFERALKKLDPAEADVLRRLDERFSMAQILLHKLAPGIDPSTPDYAKVLLDYFDCIDIAILEGEEFGPGPGDDGEENGGYLGEFHG